MQVAGSKKLEHMGIKVELIGLIELLQDRSNTYEFTSLVRELAPAARVPLPPRPADVEDGAELYDTYAHAER